MGWSVRRYRLGEELCDATLPERTLEARVELVAELSARYGELFGEAPTRLPRGAWPVRRLVLTPRPRG